MEEEIYLRIFKSKRVPLSRRDFKTLAQRAAVLDYEDGESYLHQSGKVETVALIMSGQVDVFDNFGAKHEGAAGDGFAKINVSEAWEWVDSPQFIFNINAKVPQAAAVSLICAGPTQLCVWTLDDIRDLCSANPQLSVCLLSVISQDCAIKIMKTEKYLMSSDLVRQAAHASLAESDRARHVSSLNKLPCSPKDRVLGMTDSVTIEMPDPSAATTQSAPTSPTVPHPALVSRPSRKIGSIAVPCPGPTPDEKTKKKRTKHKHKITSSMRSDDSVEMEDVDKKDKDKKFDAALSVSFESTTTSEEGSSYSMSTGNTTEDSSDSSDEATKPATKVVRLKDVVPINPISEQLEDSSGSSDEATKPSTVVVRLKDVVPTNPIAEDSSSSDGNSEPSGSPVIEDDSA